MAIVLPVRPDPEFEACFYEDQDPPVKVTKTQRGPVRLREKRPERFRVMFQVDIATGQILVDRRAEIFAEKGGD